MDINIDLNSYDHEINKKLKLDYNNFQPQVPDQIDLEDLIKDFKILNVGNLSSYLKNIWKDLCERSDNKNLGINKLTFSKYYPLPGLIFERLFSVFDKNNNEYLDINEFLEGMLILFSESFGQVSKFIFDFYDFDKDGLISREDIRVVLSYIPLTQNEEAKSHYFIEKYQLKFEKDEFKDRVESQDELHNLLEKCFQNSNQLDYKTFLIRIEKVSSEIFLFILIFLLEKRPFNLKTLEEHEGKKKNNLLFLSNKNLTKTPNPSSAIKRFMVATPNINSRLSPSVTIKKSPFWHSRALSIINGKNSKYNSGINSQNLDLKHANFLNKLGMGPNQTMDSRNILMKYSKPLNNYTEDSIMKNNEENSSSLISEKCNDEAMIVEENLMNKQSVIRKQRQNLKNLEENTNPSLIQNNNSVETDTPILPAIKYLGSNNSKTLNRLFVQDSNNFNNIKFSFGSIDDKSDEEAEEELQCEGFLYKISRGKKLKKRYFKLIDKDLYNYRNKTDYHHKSLHNLSGVFLQEGQPLQFNEFLFYSFSMIFSNKTRIYYSDNLTDYNNWIKFIKKATNYLNLNDFYEIKEKLGNGKFGMVRLGIHKENGRKVAIKIMNKSDMSISDLELANIEIEILKVAQHPNIIKILEVYENAAFIYIIMEYCAGGDLFSYIEKRQFILPEQKACSIIHKLSTAIFYLHSYGIAHRDLKPENILMTDDTDQSDIKLVDFGLSKIIGPGETCIEPFGTLTYVAPEVLLESPYNMSVDIWSLGVLTYLLLTGCLPFDDEHSEREVARKTIHEPVPFPPYYWKKLSLEAKDFVARLLQKDPAKRINVKQVLEHPWIQKYNKSILPSIRKKTKDIDKYSIFKIYSTTEDYGNI